jgi:hypothetical protein
MIADGPARICHQAERFTSKIQNGRKYVKPTRVQPSGASGRTAMSIIRQRSILSAFRFKLAFDTTQFLSILHCENVLDLDLKRTQQ